MQPAVRLRLRRRAPSGRRPAQDVGDWGVKLEALRLLLALAAGFRRVLQPHLPGVLAAAWALLASCWPAYQRAVLDGAEELDEAVRARGRARASGVALRSSGHGCTVSSVQYHLSLVCISVTDSGSRGVAVTETALLPGGGRSRLRSLHQRGRQGSSAGGPRRARRQVAHERGRFGRM